MSFRVRVWAPRASRLATIVHGAPAPMTPAGDGWWLGPELPAGTDYAIAIDGGEPRPDPRSRWQPHGVHGASRGVETSARTSAFRPVPLDRAVIYELHVGTFAPAGTFAGAIDHLDHLVALGVTHVELMPVAQFPGTFGWGYDGVDLFAPHAPYGGPAGLAALIDACHARGLAVLVDVVHNHVGPEGNYLDRFGPYHDARYPTPWGAGIAFGDAHVRRFLVDSALAWLEDYGADGLRLDALHAIRDDSPRHFVAELCDEVAALARRLGRPLVVIGEYDDHDPRVLTDWHLHAHWNDDFHHALHALLTGESHGYYQDFAAGTALAKVLHDGYALDGAPSRFRGGPHGHPFGDLPRDHLVAYTQSHDQVGNRARGERLVHLAGDGRARIAAAILLCGPFVPMLFQGEEWAASTPFVYFCDLADPALRDAVRAGRRAEHGADDAFDALDPATRDRSALRWLELGDGRHARMLRWYRALIEARATFAALRDPRPGATRMTRAGDVLRIARGDDLVLVANLGDAPARCDVRDPLLASEDLARGDELPPRSCAVVRR
jgi:maltooligosyltrehalose trehalohydrolase